MGRKNQNKRRKPQQKKQRQRGKNKSYFVENSYRYEYRHRLMSKKAKSAYKNGEKQYWEWNKSDFLLFAEKIGLLTHDIKEIAWMSEKTMRKTFLRSCGYHHVGVPAKEAEFFLIDEDKVRLYFLSKT